MQRVPAADTAALLARLACGATYRVTLQAHNAVGVSHHSPPLYARTRGDSELLHNYLHSWHHLLM